MPTRRDLLKGGGFALAGSLASAALPSRPAAASGTGSDEAGDTPDAVLVAETGTGRDSLSPVAPAGFRPGGPGPLYWSTYGYNFPHNVPIPESDWKTNIDWVAENFAPYGYRMVCTDGWIDRTQRITENGYIRTLSESWEHDWSYWIKYLAGRHMKLGVYYNPLWVTKSAVDNRAIKVAGRPDIAVADIVNSQDPYPSSGDLYWVDVTKEGAEEYVKGYVSYFRQLGVVFLRIDFLAWYETGFDQSEGTVCVGHGSELYELALSWMRQAAGGMQLSLVMPNLFDHGQVERRYGDLIRIDNDVSYGGWYFLSEGIQTWQPIWSQWNNPFLGFTGFSDLSGRGQLILDGDPLMMGSFSNDYERQTAINLFTMAGAAIAITDQYNTIGSKANASFFKNTEVLEVRRSGLVGKPVYYNGHGYDYDTSSRDVERWIGQLPDGDWVVGLFNRDDGPGTTTKSIDFVKELGFAGSGTVRDLWEHQNLGAMKSWSVALQPHASSLVRIHPSADPPHFQAEVAAWSGSARFDNTYAGFTGLGYVTGLDAADAGVTFGISAQRSGTGRLTCRVANATGTDATLEITAANPESGKVHGRARLVVPSSQLWTKWQSVSVSLPVAQGTNLISLQRRSADTGAVNLDYVALTSP